MCRRFRRYLHGSPYPVTVITDHSSLVTLNTRKDPYGRLMRYALELSEFEYVVKHRPGAKHHLPDVLSRCELIGADPEQVARQVDEALLSRCALLLQLGEAGPASDDQMKGIFSERQRELRLQLLVRGSVLAENEGYEETIKALREAHRAQQQADLNLLGKLAGEWSPFSEFYPRVAAVGPEELGDHSGDAGESEDEAEEDPEDEGHTGWTPAGEWNARQGLDPRASAGPREALTMLAAVLTRAQGRREMEEKAEEAERSPEKSHDQDPGVEERDSQVMRHIKALKVSPP